MAGKNKPRLRGIMQPILVREPLLVRVCSAFVDNLTLLLRTAFILGALFLVQDLEVMFENRNQPVAGIQPEQAAPAPLVTSQDETDEPALSDGVRHALNCTFTDYRNENFDACVNEPSHVYKRPGAEEDDTGQVYHATPVLVARLDTRGATR